MLTQRSLIASYTFKKSRMFWLGILFLMILAIVPGQTLAQDALTLDPYIITIPPNATVEVHVNGYCLNRGLPFPGETMTPGELSIEEVRVGIAHIVEQNYINQDLYQTQLAIWHLTDGLRPEEEDHNLADDIIDYAKSGVAPADTGVSVMALPEAINKGLVSAIINDYVNIAPPPFFYFGEGTLEITNLTDEVQTVHIPYGMTFKDETQSGVQDMGIFPSPAEVSETTCDPLKVTLPANASTELMVNGYCLDRTSPFPGRELTAVNLAPDKVRAAICRNVNQGYLAENLYGSQLAVWDLMDNAGTEGDELADSVVSFANSNVKPIDLGTSGHYLPDAIDQGLVSGSVTDFRNIASEPYSCFGHGTLTIANLTDSEQTIYVPYGTVYEDASQADAQNMGIFPSDGSVEVPPDVLPTSGGVNSPGYLFSMMAFLWAGALLLAVGYLLRRRVIA